MSIQQPPLCTLNLVQEVMGFTVGSSCFLDTSWTIKGVHGHASCRRRLDKFYVVGIVLKLPHNPPHATPIGIHQDPLPPSAKDQVFLSFFIQVI